MGRITAKILEWVGWFFLVAGFAIGALAAFFYYTDTSTHWLETFNIFEITAEVYPPVGVIGFILFYGTGRFIRWLSGAASPQSK
jgi:hypothetical protein